MKILSKDIYSRDNYWEKDDYIKNKKTNFPKKTYTYIVYKNHTCLDEYEREYWKFIERWIIETRAKESAFDLSRKINALSSGISTISDYYNLCEILTTLIQYEFNNKAFINFIRHFPALNHYIDKNNYKVSAEPHSIRFHIWKDDINLVMHFNDNYLIDFFSYDNDQECVNDKLIYSMKGEFSSSSNLKKSHKISRLLSIILDHQKDNIKEYVFTISSKLNSQIKSDHINDDKLNIIHYPFLHE